MNILNTYFTLILSQLTLVTGSLGLAIIVFTILLRLLLYPLTLTSLRAARKMQLLQPEIAALQKKYKKDPKALQQAQLALYKEKNINPLAGCLPQILQIGLLILLYQAFLHFFKVIDSGEIVISTTFLWMDLSKPDPLHILPILAGATQFVLSKLMMSQQPAKSVEKSKKSKKQQEEDAPGITEMAQSMQKQMMYILPIMSGVISLTLPSGLVLYWVVSTVMSIFQQIHANKTSAPSSPAVVNKSK